MSLDDARPLLAAPAAGESGKPTVVHVIGRLNPCGPVNVLRALVEGSFDRGHPLKVITLHSEGASSLADRFAPKLAGMHCLRLDHPKDWRGAAGRFREALRSMDAGVIHSHGIKPDFLCWLLGRQAGLVRLATIHSDLRADYRHTFGRVFGRVLFGFHRAVLKRMDGVVAVSRGVEVSLEGLVGPKVTLIRNGVLHPAQAGTWNPDASPFRVLPPGEGPIALSIGHLSPLKNALGLARLIASLDPALPLRAVFLGGGPLQEACQEVLSGSGRGGCEGAVGNVGDFLARAGVYLSASKCEGMPMAALEALAFGLPMILSDIPAHRELSRLCPGKILLFDPEAAGDFQRSVALLRERHLAGGDPELIDLYNTHFSAEVMAGAYGEYYKNWYGRPRMDLLDGTGT